MAVRPPDIAYLQRRVAELEAELDAAKRLSEVKLIASELRRTREALARARRGTREPVPRKTGNPRTKRG